MFLFELWGPRAWSLRGAAKGAEGDRACDGRQLLAGGAQRAQQVCAQGGQPMALVHRAARRWLGRGGDQRLPAQGSRARTLQLTVQRLRRRLQAGAAGQLDELRLRTQQACPASAQQESPSLLPHATRYGRST